MTTDTCFDSGCNGCDECVDDEDGDRECDRCHGEGMDPWNDYLLSCPACQGGQQEASK